MKYRGECEVALEKAVLGNLNHQQWLKSGYVKRVETTKPCILQIKRARINVLRVQRKVSFIKKIYKLRE